MATSKEFTENWQQQKERNNPFFLEMLVWLALHLGRNLVFPVLVIIAFYFCFFAREPKKASRYYLKKVLPNKPSFIHVWKHFYTFARVSVDRLYFLSGRTEKFDIHLSGNAQIDELFKRKQGGFLVVSHVGSFEVMRVMAAQNCAPPIHILLDRDHNPNVMKVIERLSPDLASRIVDARTPAPQLALTLNEIVQSGGLVGIMVDRAREQEKTQDLLFLNETAQFPVNPWLIALMLNAPIISCMGIFMGGNKYFVEFEHLHDGARVSKKLRQETMLMLMTRYFSRIEEHLKQAPFNWFNFYEFWPNRKP